MNLETTIVLVELVIVFVELAIIILDWMEKNRTKAKVAIWNKDAQSIVNSIAKMKNRIDKSKIHNVEEIRSGLETIGAFANGMHVSLKEEIGIKD